MALGLVEIRGRRLARLLYCGSGTRVGCRTAWSGGQAPRLAQSSTALHFPSPLPTNWHTQGVIATNKCNLGSHSYMRKSYLRIHRR